MHSDMPQGTICKTVHQYNSEPVPDAVMKKLVEIAKDYSSVKNYVYQRYGGIGGLSKIYPGYTVQNEMTASGLRARLGRRQCTFIWQYLMLWVISRINGHRLKAGQKNVFGKMLI